jgi:hypothetical protein
MPEEPPEPGSFRGRRFTGVDFTAARFADCDLREVKIADSWLVDVNISGLVDKFVVNDVDVTAYVEGELDRRHPERVQVREMRTADEHRAMWDTVERIWSEALARVRRLPEGAAYEKVDGEYSFVETLRHMIFVVDAWAARTILDEPMPYDRLGFTHSSYPPEDARELGIDLDAEPSLDEVLAVRADRVAVIRRIVDGLTPEELERRCERNPAPGYPEESRTVAQCLSVVMREEVEHQRYAVRDLAVLES